MALTRQDVARGKSLPQTILHSTTWSVVNNGGYNEETVYVPICLGYPQNINSNQLKALLFSVAERNSKSNKNTHVQILLASHELDSITAKKVSASAAGTIEKESDQLLKTTTNAQHQSDLVAQWHEKNGDIIRDYQQLVTVTRINEWRQSEVRTKAETAFDAHIVAYPEFKEKYEEKLREDVDRFIRNHPCSPEFAIEYRKQVADNMKESMLDHLSFMSDTSEDTKGTILFYKDSCTAIMNLVNQYALRLGYIPHSQPILVRNLKLVEVESPSLSASPVAPLNRHNSVVPGGSPSNKSENNLSTMQQIALNLSESAVNLSRNGQPIDGLVPLAEKLAALGFQTGYHQERSASRASSNSSTLFGSSRTGSRYHSPVSTASGASTPLIPSDRTSPAMSVTGSPVTESHLVQRQPLAAAAALPNAPTQTPTETPSASRRGMGKSL